VNKESKISRIGMLTRQVSFILLICFLYGSATGNDYNQTLVIQRLEGELDSIVYGKSLKDLKPHPLQLESISWDLISLAVHGTNIFDQIENLFKKADNIVGDYWISSNITLPCEIEKRLKFRGMMNDGNRVEISDDQAIRHLIGLCLKHLKSRE
jgi:hypothetical protein